MWIRILIAFAAVIVALGISELADGKGGCSADPTFDAEEQKFLALINQYRADNGLLQVLPNESLSTAAQWKATDMQMFDYLAHDDLDGRSFVKRLRDCGYTFNTFLGENIAKGRSTAEGVFDQWRNSPGHNANMLNSNYRAIGIGHDGVWWVTDFGGEGGVAPPPLPTEVPSPPPTSKPLPTSTAVGIPNPTPTPTHDPCGS